MIDILNKSQKSLLSLCAHALFGKPVDNTAELDDEVIDEARRQTVLPLISGFFEDKTKEKNLALNITAKNILVKNEHLDVDKMMSSVGIPYVILKGCASADYYPEPILRTMGDVDFLVPKDYIGRAFDILKSNGYFTEDSGEMLHYSFSKNDCVIELHRGINGIPKGQKGEILKEYFTDIFEKAVRSEEGFVVPSRFHHGLIILLHMVSHLIAEGLGLRHLCDWAVFVSQFSDEEFKDIFESPLKKVGLWKAAKLMTVCSVKHLGCPEKEWAKGIQQELIDALICDIFTGGNFGHKQKNRDEQIKFIGNREHYTVDNKSVFYQLFVTINSKAKYRYKFIKKHPVLLPVGWGAVVIDYIGLLLKGERSVKNWKSNIETAKVRKSIYNKIELFETNN